MSIENKTKQKLSLMEMTVFALHVTYQVTEHCTG